MPEVLVWLITGLWIAHRLAWQPLGLSVCPCHGYICVSASSFYCRLASALRLHKNTHTHALSRRHFPTSTLSSNSHSAQTNAHILARARQQGQSRPLFISRANESSVNGPLGYVVELMFKQLEVWLQMHTASMPTSRTKTPSTAHSTRPHITHC